MSEPYNPYRRKPIPFESDLVDEQPDPNRPFVAKEQPITPLVSCYYCHEGRLYAHQSDGSYCVVWLTEKKTAMFGALPVRVFGLQSALQYLQQGDIHNVWNVPTFLKETAPRAEPPT